jgi:hypothetical protein
LRTLIAIAAGTLALSATMPAAADYASPDYDRGYHDCLAGQHDQEEHVRPRRAWPRLRAKDATPRNANAGGDSADAKWPRHRSPVGIPNVAGMEPAAAGRARKGYDEAMTRRRGGESVGAQGRRPVSLSFRPQQRLPRPQKIFRLRMLSFWLLVTSRSAVTEALSETCRPSRIVKEF